MRSVAGGAFVGLALAAWASPRLAPLLFETSPRDVRVFIASGLLLLCVSLFAAAIPARRASRVDPMEALQAP